jgi:rubrerythrin
MNNLKQAAKLLTNNILLGAKLKTLENEMWHVDRVQHEKQRLKRMRADAHNLLKPVEEAYEEEIRQITEMYDNLTEDIRKEMEEKIEAILIKAKENESINNRN